MVVTTALLVAGLTVMAPLPAVATALRSTGHVATSARAAGFEVGAASADVTPPALDTPLGAKLDAEEFVPACGSSEAQIAKLWSGKRLFAFTDPYIDLFHVGQYVPGDPYCDADHAGRYQAPYIGGGSQSNRWPETSADPATNGGLDLTNPITKKVASPDPIDVQAVVFDVRGTHVALVTIDSIGVFDTTMDQIRAAVAKVDPDLAPDDIFISSTHDESAPDPIGLWGPTLSDAPAPIDQVGDAQPLPVSSGVDDYYMAYLVQKAAAAIETADADLQPAVLHVVDARMPTNVQSCWSSYPFVDTNIMPVMQGVSTRTGKVIFTLVNVGTHNETLGFSGNPAYLDMLSGDWGGRLSQDLQQHYGGVGLELAGLVGSVETPAVYPPLRSSGGQRQPVDGVYEDGAGHPDPGVLPVVPEVPGSFHTVPGNPTNGCSSVYPEPATTGGHALAPITDALDLIDVYAASVATTAAAALAGPGAATVVPTTVRAQTRTLCIELENQLFAAAFAAGIFADRPGYVDPNCRVGLTTAGSLSVTPGTHPGAAHPPTVPLYLKTEVGVLTLGPVQIAYSPGEVFPFTEVGGYVDEAQMPFPTDCYLPDLADPTDGAAGNFTCGAPLPDTPMVSAEMTTPFRFLAGLGEDMLGYMFPPGNFVGTVGETLESPWALYEDTTTAGMNGVDRFGYGHADDPESVGPHVGMDVTNALSRLLAHDGTGNTVLPGLFVDAEGHRCDSPFPADAISSGDAKGSWVTGCADFAGAVGIEVVEPNGAHRVIDVGRAPGDASAWATYFGTPDLPGGTPAATYMGTSGTARTAPFPYTTATRGVIVDERALLIDVFSGANDLGGLS
jgi:hypothetical protein